MEENKNLETVVEEQETALATAEENKEVTASDALNLEDTEVPLDRHVKLMSPTRMVIRRFFRRR